MRSRLKTTFGEKLGRYAFAPLRQILYTDKGVKRWVSPRSAFRPERGTGFAAVNQSDASVTYEEVDLNRGELIVVTHAWETMAARIRLEHTGLYRVVVRFRAVTWSSFFECRVAANGRTLSQGALGTPDATFEWIGSLRMTSGDLLDLDVNALPQPEGAPCRVVLEFAVFECDEMNGSMLRRVDDRSSGMSDEDAVEAVKTRPSIEHLVEALDVEANERDKVLTDTWVIDPATMEVQFKSQFARSATEFTRDVLRGTKLPLRKYALLMVPRSGSTMLTELLASTGFLGYPVEYFVPDIVRSFSMVFMDRFASYEDFLLRGTQSPNGVFGIEIEAERFLEERTLFAEPRSWRFVYLRREDVLSQAISLATAIRTGVWHRYSSTPAKSALLSRETILSKVNAMLAHERIFAQFFADEAVEPLKITYEELIKEPASQITRIAEYVGVEDFDLSRVSGHEVSLKPTSGPENQFYRTMAMLSGGEFYGYDIVGLEQGAAALLAGVDRALIGIWEERPPLLFMGSDVSALKARVEDYVLNALQRSLPAGSSS